MSCNVHFVSGSKVTIEDDAENVVRRLSHAQLERFEQPGNRPNIWINPGNVLYVEAAGDSPKAVGF